MSFTLPNNLIITQWHLDQCLHGEIVDFDYVSKIKLGKWSRWPDAKLSVLSSRFSTDDVWILLFAKQRNDKNIQELLTERIAYKMAGEVKEINQFIVSQQFSALIKKYGSVEADWWVYKSKKISNFDIEPGYVFNHQNMISAYTEKLGQQQRNFADSTIKNLYFTYSRKNQQATPAKVLNNGDNVVQITTAVTTRKSLSLMLNVNKRGNPTVLITGDFQPFISRDLVESCTGKATANPCSFTNICIDLKNTEHR